MKQVLDMENSKEILSSLLERPMRFNELLANLKIPNATLDVRLKQLKSLRLVKKIFDEEEGCVKYALTDEGINVTQNLLSEAQILGQKFKAIVPTITVKI
jgi:DNA-binding HxlR family transcriptional regulator